MATVSPTRADKTVGTVGLRKNLFFLALSGCIAIGLPWILSIWHADTESVHGNDHRDIQGIWRVVLVEDGGRPMPVKRGTQTVIFSGDTVRLLDQGASVPPCGSFVLDPVRNTIDLQDQNARTGNRTYPGLYNLTASRLALCMGRPGQVRPTDFETSPRNMHTLLLMERMRQENGPLQR
jgi:uncharacterized protein (TIGR03067 family)